MAPTFNQMISEVLKRSRKSARLPQDVLAGRLGVDPRLIRRYEQMTTRDGSPMKHGYKGDIVDAWLAECGWDAEIIAGPASNWVPK